MKLKLIAVFLFVIATPLNVLLCQTSSSNTPVVVEISKEKTVIDGKTYYLHTVKKSENIYRIGLAYGVTLKDIVMSNPEIISGTIKEGQLLKIPTGQKASKSIQSIESDKFIYHITEEQQTIFFLMQKYKISKEDLVKYNPELDYSPLQVGQVVRIPKVVSSPTEHETFHPIDNYIEYKAKRRDTQYSIAQKHNITVEELVAANSELKNTELQPGQILQIPVKSNVELVTKASSVKPDTILNSHKAIAGALLVKPYNNTVLKVAMLLPLFSDEIETLMMIDSSNVSNNGTRNLQTNDIYQRSLNILDFYQGALIAIDSLKKAGLSVKLTTYDVGKSVQKINSVLEKPEMAQMDLIIGPFYTDQVEVTAEFAKKSQINVISPVSDSSKTLNNNPFVFQVIPTEKVGIDAMAKYISTLSNCNVFLFNVNTDKEVTEIYKNKLNAYCTQKISEINYSGMKYNDFVTMVESRFSKDKDNVVIIPSDTKSTLTDLLSKLNVISKTYSIKVFGSPVCTAFDNIDPEILYNIQFHYFSAFYTQFNSSKVNRFLHTYRQMYNTEPTYHYTDQHPRYFTTKGYNFGLLGYDIAFYFLDLAGTEGKDFGVNMQSPKTLLHSSFQFERATPNHGWMNKGMNILSYTKNYTIEKVK